MFHMYVQIETDGGVAKYCSVEVGGEPSQETIAKAMAEMPAVLARAISKSVEPPVLIAKAD